MKRARKFKFPRTVLNSINECTQGYFLLTINGDREFEVYQNLNDSVDHLAVVSFLDVHTQVMKDKIIDQATKQLGNTRGQDDQDEGTENSEQF